MKEFILTELSKTHSLYEMTAHSVTEQAKLFHITISEDKMADNLNVRIGERYPITVKIEPSSKDYEDFTINSTSYVKIYNATGGLVSMAGEMIIDNTLKTITYIWDTTASRNSRIAVTPQQYTIIVWADITYVTSEGEVINTLIASDNITKNLVRASKLV